MYRLRFIILLAFLLSFPAFGQSLETSTTNQGAEAQAIPAGTVLQIRLRQTLSSFGSKRDSPVLAIVIAPVESGGRIILPMKTELTGTVKKLRRVGIGLASETAFIDLNFDTITLPGGQPQSIKAKIVAVDDSRETVDAKGRIHGIRATASFSSMISGFAISAGSIDPMLLGFALSSSLSVFRIPESEIILPVGAELRLKLEEPLPVSAEFPPIAPQVVESEADRAALTELIRPLPFRTATDPGNTPSDLTSLLYVGSEDAVSRAFDSAGWARSDRLDAKSTYGAMRSVIENQGYREAPVSTLVLEGQKPVFAYAKTLDTFFKRHHLRVYGHRQTYRGKPVWSSTGTHDSGIGFSRKAKTLIHIIDENIDEERGKIINDLVLTGCVDAVSFVDRSWVPRDAKNATGDSLITDGRIAVLSMNNCENPSRANIQAVNLPKVRETDSAVIRPFRNALLSIRNDFYRGNIVYQGYSGVKLIGPALRKSKQAADPGKPRIINYGGEEFQIVAGSAAIKPPGAPKDPGHKKHSFQHLGEDRSYKTLLDFSFTSGYGWYGNSAFSTQPLNLIIPDLFTVQLRAIAEIRSGWSVGGRITLNSWRHFSNEFFYSYARSSLRLTFQSPGLDDFTSSSDLGAQTRQFGYNLLAHLRPNGSRVRPYIAGGPLVQLYRTVDSKPKTNALLKFGVKDLGLIVGAYEFGSKPPLEGGGIFHLGAQYGGGVKFQVTPRFFTRIDFRESLTPQPDFWSKSYASLRSLLSDGSQQLVPLKLEKHGPLRRHALTLGFGLSF